MIYFDDDVNDEDYNHDGGDDDDKDENSSNKSLIKIDKLFNRSLPCHKRQPYYHRHHRH